MFRKILLITCCVSALLCCGLHRVVAASEDAETEAYVVQAQQSIASIAAEYGITPGELASRNHLHAGDRLVEGQVLLVPIGAQLAPQASQEVGGMTATLPTAPSLPSLPLLSKNQVQGIVATVAAKQTRIYNQPHGGQVIFKNLTHDTKLLVIDQTETHYAVLMSDGSTGWVPRIALQLSDTTTIVTRPTAASIGGAGRQEIVDTAKGYLGIPYKYGGALPDTVDCSLFVQSVFRQFGVNLPRTAADQFQVGVPVAPQDLVAGDRLYFHERHGEAIIHTAIYIGNGQFIHASSNRGMVAIDDLTNPTYASIFAGARR